jgi:mannose-6-phosphate isomerase-like protein (cupin superfamily)
MSMGAQSGMLIDRSASGCPVMKSEDKESSRLNESEPSKLTPVSTMNAVQYIWGEECKAWFLLKNPKLTVIQEEMPPGSSELLHFHHKAQQLFYILRGEAIMEIGDKFIELKPSQSLHIAPGNPHRIRNAGSSALQFIVISEPESHGDKVLVTGSDC